MTVIAAVHDPYLKRTYIGSDTISVTDGTILKNGPKWVRHGNWAAGMAGDKVAFNIVQAHAESIFKDPPGAWTIAMRIRDLFSEYGFHGDGEAGPQGYEQNIIIACPQGVWHVGSNFGLVEIPAGELWGDGAGRQYALGAAHAAKGWGFRQQLEAAIAAACRYDNDCGGEPWIDVLGVQNVTINFGGPVSQEFADSLVEQFRDTVERGDAVIIDPNSRQARELSDDDKDDE